MEQQVNFGGNGVSSFERESAELVVFNRAPYYYALLALTPGKIVLPLNLEALTIYVLALSNGAELVVSDSGQRLRQGDAVQADFRAPLIELKSGHGQLLVAGVEKAPTSLAPQVLVMPSQQIKKVTKPWGHELWINGQHPGYALKQIAIRAPYKTSLQYHNFKQETNVLLEGRALLHYCNDTLIASDKVRGGDISTTDLIAPCVIQVSPPTVHRIEALTDLLLFEASTPHLDDVVRISDDAGRPDGRIEAEHSRV